MLARSTYATTLLLLSLLASAGQIRAQAITAESDTAESDEAQIERIVRTYVEAWKAGDTLRLGEVLAPNGSIMWISGADGEKTLQSMTFAEILERGRSQRVYDLRSILSVDIVDGNLAVAKVNIARSGGSYIDYLVMYKIGEQWRIVNKTFVIR